MLDFLECAVLSLLQDAGMLLGEKVAIKIKTGQEKIPWWQISRF